MADLGKYRLPIFGVGVVVMGLLVLIAWTAYRPATKEKPRGEPTTAGPAVDEPAVIATAATPVTAARPARRAPDRPPPGAPPAPADDGTCSVPFTPCGNACVNIREDSTHCGGCGKACPSGEWCLHGACYRDKCKSREGEAECFGTCKNLLTDPKNCGECTNVCEADQTCKEGQCDPPHVPEAGVRPFFFDGGRPPLPFPFDGGRPVFPRPRL